MKETLELGQFLGMSVSGAKEAANGNKSLLQRIGDFTPTLIYAPTGLGGLEAIDEEIEAGQKVDFDELDSRIYDQLANFNEPARSIIAKSLTTVVVVVGSTVSIGKDPQTAEGE